MVGRLEEVRRVLRRVRPPAREACEPASGLGAGSGDPGEPDRRGDRRALCAGGTRRPGLPGGADGALLRRRAGEPRRLEEGGAGERLEASLAREGEKARQEGAGGGTGPHPRGLRVELDEPRQVGEAERGGVGHRRGDSRFRGDDGPGDGDPEREETGRRKRGEGLDAAFPGGSPGGRERLLRRPGRGSADDASRRERRGEGERGEPGRPQEGIGPSASGLPSARIRTSSSWKKSDVARTCSGVLSA